MADYRLVIVEDDDDVCALVELLVEMDPRFEVVGIAAVGETGVALVRDERPDAVILDLELPRLSGLDAIPRMHREAPESKIVVFSSFPDPFTLMDVLRNGADGYLD